MLQKHIKDELIILKRNTVNEKDTLIISFGRFSGKILLKARGIKNINSRFIGRLEPLTVIKAQIYNSGKSLTLTGAEAITAPPLAPSYRNFEINQIICKILCSTLPNEEANPSIFEDLKEVIEVIREETKEDEALLIFYMKYLKDSGHLPVLNQCFSCTSKLTDSAYMDGRGHLLCNACAKENEGYINLSVEQLKVMNYYSSTPTKRALGLTLPDRTKEELKENLPKIVDRSFD